jgi:hypothetical protein
MKKVVKNKRILAIIAVGLLAILLAVSGVIASPPMGAGDPPVESKINYQGQLTDSAGNPLNDTYDMEFLFYDSAAGGSQVGSTITKSGVEVTNGLFSVKLDVDQSDFDGQGLWLEVIVEGETLSPRQEILPVPYALSLKPGADIAGTLSGPVLWARNDGDGITAVGLWATSVNAAGVYGESTYGIGVSGVGHDNSIGTQGYNTGSGIGVKGDSATGHGVEARSAGGASTGTALWAQNTNSTNGIAIWAKNDSADTTLVVGNDGSGPLIKGFGGDGGEDEFRVSNNGKIETKADSYIFVPGIDFVKKVNTDSTRWDCQLNGSVTIWRGATTGAKWIFIPVTLPGVLYGQDVKVESLTVYYKCQDGTKNYISSTFLYKQTDADSDALVVSDTTHRTSNTAASYTLTLTTNNTLSSSQGILGLYLYLWFVDDTNYIQIGGARLQLGHHHLY